MLAAVYEGGATRRAAISQQCVSTSCRDGPIKSDLGTGFEKVSDIATIILENPSTSEANIKSIISLLNFGRRAWCLKTSGYFRA